MTNHSKLVDDLSPRLMKWAWGKTGSQEQAEDLTQEVLLQYLTAAAQQEAAGQAVREPERFLWRVARFVWLKRLRLLTAHRTVPLQETHPDPRDLSADVAERDEQNRQATWVRQKVMNLGRIQREAMVLHYVHRLPQREVARRLGVSEATLRWHLCDTRKKLREGADDMNTAEFVYTPRQLGMGINGQDTPDNATRRVGNSLLMQNLCCACYH